MPVTRSWEQSAIVAIETAQPRFTERPRELPFLLGASLFVSCGLALVFAGKTQSFPEFGSRLSRGEFLNLNADPTPDQIAPFLQNFSDPQERSLAAAQVQMFLEHSGPLPNIGALSRLRVNPSEIETDYRWTSLRAELQRRLQQNSRGMIRLPVVPVSKLKPSLIVRTPTEFVRQFLLWCGIYIGAFWVVHLAWRWRCFRGDPAILPALHLLTGIGLMLTVSLRDPLRDSLDFKRFAWGCALGCMLLLLPLFRLFQHRNFARWIYTPLLAALLLFALLLVKGSGPSGSDARVNLGPFQPVEFIKVLLVFFLAGYFARHWEWLRELRERRVVPTWLRWPRIPRLSQTLPVVIGVAVALGLFFVLKDMGPALVIGFLFLTMFAVARGRFALALSGIAILVAGVTVGYRLGAPATVVDRINMWQSPWDNSVHGGDQIAHSLWAFSTGGPWGSGPGRGDPGMIPAGHTDLVLPSIAEEWGFPGTCIIFALFFVLIYRAFRIARDAADEYATFLAFGLGALIALEMLLISGGALDAIPLSGVVSPFLSSGNSAMLANFLIFAILLGISNQSPRSNTTKPVFMLPIRVLSVAFAMLGLVLIARAAYFQVYADREFVVHDAKVFADDGVKRAQRNPRLNSLMRQIPRGDIYDRNGILLASSDWKQIESRRNQYAKLGILIDQTCSRLDSRHYPFGPAVGHLLGDTRTGENFHASNASLIEHDDNARLQGYSTIDELAPAIRFRHYPDDPHMRAIRDRNRDVRSSLDVRLQLRIAETVRIKMDAAGSKGSVVVMDSHSGDILAMVNAPQPVTGQAPSPDQLLDRARYGQYPPGSTFKIVTAMAALRLDPQSTQKTYSCVRLPDGRAGTKIAGWNRPIRDDIKDHPHGTLNMFQAITVSCNAYFAQLGVFTVGSNALRETAQALEVSPGDFANFKQMLPFSAYGQGPVLVTPFKMARVAATIADDGAMPQGRWVIDESNLRTAQPRAIVSAESARFIARAMRSVVTNGTGRSAMAGLDVPVAGKTGTAQVENGEPHSWFAGFAPYQSPGEENSAPKIAFAVIVEHGGYGAHAAAPIAREVIEAARDLGIITSQGSPLISEKK